MSDVLERKIGDVTVTIDRSVCIAADNCTRVAPEIFTLDDSNLVSFRDDIPASVDRERIADACASCPVDAISARDADGNALG